MKAWKKGAILGAIWGALSMVRGYYGVDGCAQLSCTAPTVLYKILFLPLVIVDYVWKNLPTSILGSEWGFGIIQAIIVILIVGAAMGAFVGYIYTRITNSKMTTT